MVNRRECPYCKKEIVYQIQQQFAGHCGVCKENSNAIKRIEKAKQTVLNKRKDYEFKCKKCEKLYIVNLTPHLYKIGKYRKHCSRKCVNSHTFTEEQKKKKK